MNNVHKIWDDIGIDFNEKEQRSEKLLDYLQDTLDKIVQGEVQMKNSIIKGVKKNYKEYTNLCLELNVPESIEDIDSISLLELDQCLKSNLSDLQAEVKRRQGQFKDLLKQEKDLCERLEEDPTVSCKTIPSLEDIKDLEDKIKTLKVEMGYRQQSFRNLKDKIQVLYSELDESPNSTFGRSIFSSIEDLFTLSQKNMKDMKALSKDLETKILQNEKENINLLEKIKKLWNRLEVCPEEQEEFAKSLPEAIPRKLKVLRCEHERLEDLKLSNLACFIGKIKSELEEWWDKCYTSEEEKNAFKPYFEDQCSEEILSELESKVEKMKEVYKNAEKLYTRLDKRQNLWIKFMELDSNINNPNRLFGNRGCALLQEEKERKKINNELPKIENELERLSEVWEEDNQKLFLVHGVPLNEYFKNQWEAYKDQKQNEKLTRQVKKANELEVESRLGSVPRGAKRKIINRSDTLSRTKQLKLSDSRHQFGSNSNLSSTRSNSTKSSFMSSTLATNSELSYTPRSYATRSALKEQSFNTPYSRTLPKQRTTRNTSFLKRDITLNGTTTPSQQRNYKENLRNASKTPFIPHPTRNKPLVTPMRGTAPRVIPKTAPVNRRRSGRLLPNMPNLSPITPAAPRIWGSNLNSTVQTPTNVTRNKLNFLM